ncbi:MAG: hypothetical protein R3348_10020, partial [Xanthomonadales bacterium]|nr:hypothetical protein [Xanthomonadales bacterium]
MGNLGSLLVVLISGIAAYRIRFDRWDVDNPYLVSLLLGLLLCSVVLPATGAYRREFRWDPFRKTRRLLAGWALVVTSMVVLAALLKVSADYSRIWFGSWVVITALGLGCIAFVEYTWLVRQARKGRYQRQIVLVGNGPAAQRIEAKIAQDPAMQLIIIDRFGQDWGGEATRPLDTLEAYIAEHRPAEVWIAAENNQPGFLESALRALRNATADVHVVPDLHQYRFLNQKVDEWQ